MERLWIADRKATCEARGASANGGALERLRSDAFTWSGPRPNPLVVRHASKNMDVLSADIKLLELWCSWKEGGKQAMPPFTFGPNEAPMVGRAWELLRQDGIAAKLAPHVQRQLGLWRTAGLQ